MSENQQKRAPTEGQPSTIALNYVKSNQFRVVHVDGVFGGMSPTGLIHASIFSERFPIPQIIRQVVKEDGTLGEEVDRTIREGVIREAEVDLVMSREVAVVLRDWLTTHINKHDEVRASKTSKIDDQQ
jgi:hypothetical protein